MMLNLQNTIQILKCTFYEYFDIVLNNDTISSAHSDCSYEGFENFRDALKEEVIYVDS